MNIINNLMSGDLGVTGIYRAKLLTIEDETDIRVYVPGVNNICPFDANGNIDLEIYNLHKKSFPKVQWCCYNLESKDLTNQDSLCWVMFENGDFRRPVIISYAVIGGVGSGVGTDIYNPGGITGTAGVGTEVIIPEGYGTVETYEKETGIGGKTSDKYHGWAKGSAQHDLRVKAIDSGRMTKGNIFGLENCAIIDNRLLIATKQNVGGTFPLNIGDYVDVCFSDGTVWNCIIGDFKGSDAPNPWGHNNGKGVVEIIYWDYSHNSGNQYKKVDKLIKVGKYE